MPGPGGPWGDDLVAAVESGEVDESVVDDHLARLLRLAERVGAVDAALRTHLPEATFRRPEGGYFLWVSLPADAGHDVARIVTEAGAGWVTDSSKPDEMPRTIAAALADPVEAAARGDAARDYAERNFSQDSFGAAFSELLQRSR